jgi:hypothetical protein
MPSLESLGYKVLHQAVQGALLQRSIRFYCYARLNTDFAFAAAMYPCGHPQSPAL